VIKPLRNIGPSNRIGHLFNAKSYFRKCYVACVNLKSAVHPCQPFGLP
jgi:hypothetical protein